jgi:hypothetical protein
MSSYENRTDARKANLNEGRNLHPPGESFPQIFGRVARAIYPHKTAFALAALANVSDRAAKDWLSGKVPPPAWVVANMFVEVTRRE